MAKYNIFLEETTVTVYQVETDSYEKARILFDQGEKILVVPSRTLDSQIVEIRKTGE